MELDTFLANNPDVKVDRKRCHITHAGLIESNRIKTLGIKKFQQKTKKSVNIQTNKKLMKSHTDKNFLIRIFNLYF